MAIKKSSYVSGVTPMPSPAGAEVVNVSTSLALTTTDIGLNNVIETFILPAGCVPVGYVVGATDMDTNATPLLAANFGLLNAGETAVSTAAADGGAAWLAALTLGVPAAITLSTATKAAYDVLRAVQPASVDRIVAFVISAAAATAASGTLTLEMSYKAAN